MAFTLFPPLGAKVKNVITVPLPWLHPLMDGRGGSKKSSKNFSLSEGCEHSERHDNVVPSASPSKIPDFQEFPTQNLLIQQPSITFHLQHFFSLYQCYKKHIQLSSFWRFKFRAKLIFCYFCLRRQRRQANIHR